MYVCMYEYINDLYMDIFFPIYLIYHPNCNHKDVRYENPGEYTYQGFVYVFMCSLQSIEMDFVAYNRVDYTRPQSVRVYMYKYICII